MCAGAHRAGRLARPPQLQGPCQHVDLRLNRRLRLHFPFPSLWAAAACSTCAQIQRLAQWYCITHARALKWGRAAVAGRALHTPAAANTKQARQRCCACRTTASTQCLEHQQLARCSPAPWPRSLPSRLRLQPGAPRRLGCGRQQSASWGCRWCQLCLDTASALLAAAGPDCTGLWSNSVYCAVHRSSASGARCRPPTLHSPLMAPPLVIFRRGCWQNKK